MKKRKNTQIPVEAEQEKLADSGEQNGQAEQKPDVNERIYNFLDGLEKVAIKAAKINAVLREYRIKSQKKQKKKNKKIGKINKKTGAVKLKKEKKIKKAKALKRYEEKKKK